MDVYVPACAHVSASHTHTCMHGMQAETRGKYKISGHSVTVSVCVCACVSWRIKLRIIETHDSIPYKLLDKGLRVFYSSLRPHPSPSFLPSSKFRFWSQHFTTRDIFVRVCAYFAPLLFAPLPLACSILSFSILLALLSSCLIAGSVLLCFSQHEKNILTVGKKFICPVQRSWKKRKLSLPIALSFSLPSYNLNFPLISLRQYIHLQVYICLFFTAKFFLFHTRWGTCDLNSW